MARKEIIPKEKCRELLIETGLKLLAEKPIVKGMGREVAKQAGVFQSRINDIFGNLENFWKTVRAERQKAKEKTGARK